ncbi:nicotinate-nucleotide adenylyltransferase [Lysobacter humi (ex Lee et al. 2017)]
MRAYVGYGGTFDPVHRGHVAVALHVRATLGVDVHLVPAADPPHKDATHADARHRLRMVELAVAGERGLRVDARELSRDAPSYTVDTLLELRAQLGSALPVVWMIGADSLSQLHRWHRWRELFALAHVLTVARPGHATMPEVARGAPAGLVDELTTRLSPLHTLLDAPAGRLALLPVDPPREESSTAVRARIAAGQPWRHFVPAPVAAYIDRHRLYAPGVAA